MRKVLIATAAAFVALGLTAINACAADKGTPPPAVPVEALKTGSNLQGCYVESSLAGTYLRSTREAIAGIGGGCDVVLANLVLGAGTRADWGDLANTQSVFAKLGISINNGATLYGLAEWKVRDLKLGQSGQLAIGAGAELQLQIINPALSVFAEGSFVASKFGTATKDDVNTRLGLRYRF